jgi:hypothetical protein
MNAPVVLAQLSGSPLQPDASPKTLKVDKPQNGQAVTLHLDGSTRLDFSDVASEKLTFVRVGDKLIVLFDNQSTVTIEPVFDVSGHPLPDVVFEMTPDHTLTGDQFTSLFPISTDPSILPAAGVSGPAAGANFSDPPAVDPLTVGTPLAPVFVSGFDIGNLAPHPFDGGTADPYTDRGAGCRHRGRSGHQPDQRSVRGDADRQRQRAEQ